MGHFSESHLISISVLVSIWIPHVAPHEVWSDVPWSCEVKKELGEFLRPQNSALFAIAVKERRTDKPDLAAEDTT